jgi:hypothetical protein
MADDTTATYRKLLQLQGVGLAEARAASLAELLERQLGVERRATAQFAFELEPANFAGTLRDGAK